MKAAYAKTHLLPMSEGWVELDGDTLSQCACALSAVAIAEDRLSFDGLMKLSYELNGDGVRSEVAGRIGLDVHYARGFIAGFDGDPSSTLYASHAAFTLGFADGVLARAEIHPRSRPDLFGSDDERGS